MTGRESRADPVTRALVVVGLVAIAAVALPGRRGLDWDALTEPPKAGWARAVLVGAATAWLAVGLLNLRRLFRRRFRLPPAEEQAEGQPHRLHWSLHLLAVLLVVGAFALALAVLVPEVNQGRDTPTISNEPPGQGTGLGVPEPGVPLLLGVLLALVAALAVARIARRRVPAAIDWPEEPDEEPGPDAAALAQAVTVAGRVLGEHDDTRAGIIAAYAAMEHNLARRGTRREASDTPTELLDRAVAAGLVSGGAAGRLTELFREARFSRHLLPGSARRDAEAALVGVSEELAGQRV